MIKIEKCPIENPSKECLERNYCLQLEMLLNEQKHKLKMEQLTKQRENDCLLHNEILERGRIQRAEERKRGFNH
jgi:hypothetical protein